MAIDQTAAPATIAPARSGIVTASGGPSFRTLLSDLNPLQYIPVVGALYRAATGDEGNPTLRFVASLGTSFALGGPVGVGITVAEKVTGFDPERIVRSLLGHLFHHPAPATAPAASSPAAAPPTAVATAVAAAPAEPGRPWTSAELAAYAPTGVGEADRLNGLELQRLSATYV